MNSLEILLTFIRQDVLVPLGANVEFAMHWFWVHLTWANFGWFTLANGLMLWPMFFLLFNICAGEVNKTNLIAWLIGAFNDIWTNVFLGTVLFADAPNVNRLFLSARMDYIIVKGSNGPKWLQAYRLWLALRIVGILLAPYDKTKQHNTHGQWPVNKESNANA